METKIPSSSRSQGAQTPRRRSRRTLSVGSPALSTASGKLTTVVEGFINVQMNSFALSPLPKRRSVLTDNTDIVEEPRRKSWWKKLNENSRDVLEILGDNNLAEPNNIMEELDMEILSQEKKNYTLDIPESSDGESINSIVIPQRKLFTQKDCQQQKKFGQIIGTRDTITKSNKNTTKNDKIVNAGTKELFQNKQRSKPLFPAALLDISLDKTISDKTKEFAAEPKVQARNIFGNCQGTKRKNMFANFIASESEDEVSDIQPRVFGFPKKLEAIRRGSSTSRGVRDSSPTSNVTTDVEMDDWRLLPSSTMVEHQLEAMMEGNTPIKKSRLSKLAEDKESSETNTVSSKSKSPEINTSVLTRSRLRALNDKSTRAAEKNKTLEKNSAKQNKTPNREQNQINKSFQSDSNSIADKSQRKMNKSKEIQNKSQQMAHTSLTVTDGIQSSQKSTNKNQSTLNDTKNKSLDKLKEKVINESQKIKETEEVNECQGIDEEVDEREQEEDEIDVVESENDENESHKIDQDSDKEQESEECVNESQEQNKNEEKTNESHEQIEKSNEQEAAGGVEEVAQSQQEIDEINEEGNENSKVVDESKTQEESPEQVNESQEEVGNINEVADEDDEGENEVEENQQEIDEINEENNENSNVVDESNEQEESHEQVNESQEKVENSNEVADEDEGENDVEVSQQEIDESNEEGNENSNVVDESNEQDESHEQVNESQEEVKNSNEVAEDEDDEGVDELEESNQDAYENNESVDQTQEEIDESNEIQEDEIQNDDADEDENDEAESDNAELHYESEEMEVDDELQNNTDDTPNNQEKNADISGPAHTNESNISHDTTGRNRHQNQSPEAILHDKTKQTNSFSARRNTSVRKTKSMVNPLNNKPSPIPTRNSVGFSDGTTNSSAEGSGWDSHRTTRKTIRQTFGRDATPRKSLRALVMEKSAKRQTLASETAKFPLANSTALPEITSGYLDIEPIPQESTHEVSLRTRQLTLKAFMEKIKEDNLKEKARIGESVKKFTLQLHSDAQIFKVPLEPKFHRQVNPQKKNKVKAASKPAWVGLPEEMIADLQYRPPKRYQPSNAPWITKRLYKYLESKLESKYDYKARVRAEKLVETIYTFTKDLRRQNTASEDAVNVLKHEMARLQIVKTHFEFYEFFHEFLPREIIVKVVPDIVNNIRLPKEGVFSEIIPMSNTMQG